MGAERLLLLLMSALSVGAAPSQPHAADISAASAVAFAPVPPEIGTGATALRAFQLRRVSVHVARGRFGPRV